ncbi:N-6 DNA methylase [Dysgonomonas gadei]|uniref:N-6 DNA methylase n=1 Tax=Dysgonomonas gadei TaxID=156974 RepID=UPI003AEFCE0A
MVGIEEGIHNILDAYKKRQDIDKYAYTASYEEIAKKDYNLNIPRYVNLYSNII